MSGGKGHIVVMSSFFMSELRDATSVDARPKRWVFVPYDQLTSEVGPLAAHPAYSLGLIFIETSHKAALRPYHKQKLALLLSNMRHFALEQARRGATVRYLGRTEPYADVLATLKDELGEIVCMQPSEYELRRAIAPFVTFVPNETWVSEKKDFARLGNPPWRMDAFYRHMRQKTGILMDGGSPRGGKMSLDGENREPYRGTPAAPELLPFTPDAITREVGELVETKFHDHPGRLDLTQIAATKDDVARLWAWVCAHCLVHFGPFEDAMSSTSPNLFHTRISPYLNLSRILAKTILRDVEQAEGVPLNSQEGLIRQVLGWREYMHHVHRETEGLTDLGNTNFLAHKEPLPDAYWGVPSGLHCLDTVVAGVMQTGHSHHITRLMVLSNIANLIGIDPHALTHWFWCAYIDAYDWVVETNVLGMATYALGGLMITKPYISGSGYIHRMSDFCDKCAFHPKKTCPLTPMYWNYLGRHQKSLAGNSRMHVPLRAQTQRAAERRALDEKTTQWVRTTLRAGQTLHPDERPQ